LVQLPAKSFAIAVLSRLCQKFKTSQKAYLTNLRPIKIQSSEAIPILDPNPNIPPISFAILFTQDI